MIFLTCHSYMQTPTQLHAASIHLSKEGLCMSLDLCLSCVSQYHYITVTLLLFHWPYILAHH